MTCRAMLQTCRRSMKLMKSSCHPRGLESACWLVYILSASAGKECAFQNKTRTEMVVVEVKDDFSERPTATWRQRLRPRCRRRHRDSKTLLNGD